MVIRDRHIEILENSIDIINQLRFELIKNNIALLQKEPRESGNNIQIQCPYHSYGQEKKPSAGIRKSDGIFHCFSCGETHSLQEVISYCFDIDDNGEYGFRWLMQHFTVQPYKGEITYQQSEEREHEEQTFVSEEELDNYRWTHPYWSQRGISDDWLIEKFDLGYDREHKMITFPIRDIDGRCLFVAKRSVNSKFFNYPQGVYKPVYGLYELQGCNIVDELFICESMIDCLLLWQSGYYAVALNGLGTEYQYRQISNLPVVQIILCTDNDDAGKKARKNLRKHLIGKVFSEIVFPKGIKDIGECSREQIDNILDWRKYDWEV